MCGVKLKVIETNLKDCILIEPQVFEDDRGFFLESFNKDHYKSIGIASSFVQDNHSSSMRNVLRGLHFQRRKPQGKLVRVVRGEVLDVALDIRPNSPTFKKWEAVKLSEDNKRQFWIPPGFAHGFLVLSDTADFEYKCTEYYYPDDEMTIRWNDPSLQISWGVDSPIISKKDANAPFLSELDL